MQSERSPTEIVRGRITEVTRIIPCNEKSPTEIVRGRITKAHSEIIAVQNSTRFLVMHWSKKQSA